MPEPYPHRWVGQDVIVVHHGGEATGELTEVNDVVGAGNRTPHLLLKSEGRILYLPIHGISYISTVAPRSRRS